jgi:hypothetical protein
LIHALFEASTRQSPRAHTLAPKEKKPFGRIALSLLDFRWAPD